MSRRCVCGHYRHGMCQHELALSVYCIYMHKNSVRLKTVGGLSPLSPMRRRLHT